jgi:hypothetical protein
MSCGLLEIYTLNKLATRASTYKGSLVLGNIFHL